MCRHTLYDDWPVWRAALPASSRLRASPVLWFVSDSSIPTDVIYKNGYGKSGVIPSGVAGCRHRAIQTVRRLRITPLPRSSFTRSRRTLTFFRLRRLRIIINRTKNENTNDTSSCPCCNARGYTTIPLKPRVAGRRRFWTRTAASRR